MTEPQHMLLVGNHLEGLSQAWWLSHQNYVKLYMELREEQDVSNTLNYIATWMPYT